MAIESNTGQEQVVVPMIARKESTTASTWKERTMCVFLFTGVEISVISEHIIRNMLDIEKMDTVQQEIEFGDGRVKSLGQIKVTVCLGCVIPSSSEEEEWREITFHVLPISFVEYRFDAALSDKDIDTFDKCFVKGAIENRKAS